MAEIQKYNRQTNQLSIHYFTKKIMDLGVLFLPNSIKKYLTTPPTKNEISHVQHHARTNPYTLNLPASFIIHKVWISFQVYKWPRTAVDKNYGSLRKNVRFHNYSFLLSWQTHENGPIKITLPVFSSLMSHNLQIISLSVCCIRWWRIRLDGSVLFMRLPTNQQPVAWSYFYFRYGRVNITSKSSFNWFKIDILSLVRPLTAICRPVQGHLNYYIY